MNLRTLIDHYFGGSRRIFQQSVGVSERTVTRWINDDAVVANGAIYLRVNTLPEVPDLPPPDNREQFEALLLESNPEADLTRVGDGYISEPVRFAWTGWMLAMDKIARDDVGIK